tara:strand:+ start:63 stop:296 length:234 start_codon:yes stop_codon:yes gene_type:complete
LIKLSAEAVDLTVGNIGSNDDCRVKLLIEDTTFYFKHTCIVTLHSTATMRLMLTGWKSEDGMALLQQQAKPRILECP